MLRSFSLLWVNSSTGPCCCKCLPTVAWAQNVRSVPCAHGEGLPALLRIVWDFSAEINCCVCIYVLRQSHRNYKQRNIYVYSSRRQNTIKIQTDRQTDIRLFVTKSEYNKNPNRQTDRQTLQLIPQHHSNAHNIREGKNHIILVLKCSYTTHVNSLKFIPITLRNIMHFILHSSQ